MKNDRPKSKYLFLNCLIMLVITFCTLRVPLPAQAAETNTPKVLIFLINSLSLGDVNSEVTPCLWKLQNEGATGLLIPQLNGESSAGDSCCTISAGQNAVSSPDAARNFMARENYQGEKTSALFTRQTGIDPGEAGIVVNSIASIEKSNQEHGQVHPGELGEKLHQLGCKTVVIGNSDRPGYYRRLGPLVLMNKQGLVDGGAIDDNIHVSYEPGQIPYQSDYTGMLKQAAAYNDSKAVILFELGDLSRLDSMNKYYRPGPYNRQREVILSRLDSFIGQAIGGFSTSPVSIYILNPNPYVDSDNSQVLFAPLIIYKTGLQGTITSFSIRRPGFVPLSSLHNSIISCLDPAQPESLVSSPRENVPDFLNKLNRDALFRYVNQTCIMTFTVILIVLSLLAALILILARRRPGISSLLLPFIAAFPLSLLLAGALPFSNPAAFIVFLLFINLGISCLSAGLGRLMQINNLIPLLLATIAVLAGDLVTGARLISGSLMSYQITGGARYYGLGNEYMGVLLGAAISLAALSMKHPPSCRAKLLIAGLFLIITVLIGSPYWGINVGGAITAVIGLSYTFLILSRQPVGLVRSLGILLSAVLFVALMACLDLRQPPQLQSHLGHGITSIINGGINAVIPVISHKLAMAFQYINYTIWGWVFLLLILGTAGLFFHPRAWLERQFQSQPYILLGLKGLLLSAITAILFNDSGLTAAAAIAIYFFVVLLYCLKQHNAPPLNSEAQTVIKGE